MDYGYSTTSYGAQGGADGGGFMPGSQSDSPSGKRSYGKDTLRPVTIKQLIEAHHPFPDAEYFMIDNSETTQITFVGQVRNISSQTTNTTYKVDDGTGAIEVKEWKDAEALSDPDHPSNQRPKPSDQGYARVWGRLKAFNNKRHVGANVVRPIMDVNEIQYHLLEATAVHLHFSRGPPESMQAKGDANGMTNGATNGGQNQTSIAQGFVPPGVGAVGRKVLNCIRNTEQTNEGLHMQDIAMRIGEDISEVQKAGDELQSLGAIYTTVDDHTWALLDV